MRYSVTISAEEMGRLRPVLTYIIEESKRKRERAQARQMLKNLEGFRDWAEDETIPFRQVWMKGSDLEFLRTVSDAFDLDIEAARHWRE